MKQRFRFEAFDSAGGTTTGTLEALDENDAVAQLRAQSLTATRLEPVAAKQRTSGRSGTSANDKVMLIRELATLLRAGISLADAVESLATARSGDPLGESLQRASRALNSGQSFVSALDEARIRLPAYVRQLAATGEMTGKLASALGDAARQMEYDEKVRQELRNSLTYPAILVIAGVSAVLLIFLFVIPRFATMIRGSRSANIPELSLWIINTGVFLRENLLWLAIAICLLAGLTVWSLRDPTQRSHWLTRIAQLPVIGQWLADAEIGRWATTLGTLLGNRVPILSALELSTSSLQLPATQQCLVLVIRDVRAGETLADALAKHGMVSTTGINLIRVGEKTGELPKMVATLGDLYSEAGRNRIARFLLLLEPIAILTIGGLIGLLMMAVMLTVTNMNGSAF